jgi:hypothetical protein
VKLPRGADALSVGAAKLVVSLAVLGAGFVAVSDDDYARIVIAQRFAETPHLDPSGTSWLPLPFWVYGAAFRLFGGSFVVARVTAVLVGIASMGLLLVAARWLGAGRFGAFAGALVGSLFPWSAWLGAAPLPEVPAAALSVLAMAALVREEPRVRTLGAAAIAASCFCRYEGWPVALAFAVVSLHDAARAAAPRRSGLLLASGLALLPIAAWLLHGVFIHGDATFFWKRVAAYKNALGEAPSFSERFWTVPRSLLTGEPELVLALVLVGMDRTLLQRFARPALAAGALIAFLMAGELSGGGPTHHAARAVLPVWFLIALAIGSSLERRGADALGRSWAWLGSVLALVGLGWIFRAGTPPAFADRSEAVAIGTRARELGAPGLFIDTPDYSYLAVTAAYRRPNAAEPFDDRDPRHERAADPFASEHALRSRILARPEAWLVVSREHAPLARRLGAVRAETARFMLVAPQAPTLTAQP